MKKGCVPNMHFKNQLRSEPRKLNRFFFLELAFRFYKEGLHKNQLSVRALYVKYISRDDWIRTSGPYVPNVVRYRAALHPEMKGKL